MDLSDLQAYAAQKLERFGGAPYVEIDALAGDTAGRNGCNRRLSELRDRAAAVEAMPILEGVIYEILKRGEALDLNEG